MVQEIAKNRLHQCLRYRVSKLIFQNSDSLRKDPYVARNVVNFENNCIGSKWCRDSSADNSVLVSGDMRCQNRSTRPGTEG
jgi:hypothetical protein